MRLVQINGPGGHPTLDRKQGRLDAGVWAGRRNDRD